MNWRKQVLNDDDAAFMVFIWALGVFVLLVVGWAWAQTRVDQNKAQELDFQMQEISRLQGR